MVDLQIVSFAAVFRLVTQRWEERCVTSLKTAAKETKLQTNTLIMTLDVRYDLISFGDYLKCNFLTTFKKQCWKICRKSDLAELKTSSEICVVIGNPPSFRLKR